MVVPLLVASPAEAAFPANPGCKATTTAGALIGHYPAWNGTQSSLFVACVFRSEDPSPPGVSDVSSKWSIHDFVNAVYHQGGARTVTVAGAPAPAPTATTFTITNCVGMTTAPNAWKNRGIAKITGTGTLPARTALKSITAACLVTLNKPAAPVLGVGATLKVENSNVRQIGDGVIVAGTNHVCSATEANFDATAQPSNQSDLGLSISGTQIPSPGPIPTITGTFVGAPCPAGVSGATFSGPPAIACPAGVPAANCLVVTIGGTQDNQSVNHASTTRTVNDATYGAITTITSPAARWRNTDIGCPVYGNGAGFSPTAYITAIAGTTATISPTNGGTAGTHIVTICDPSLTAPTDGEGVLTQGVQLDLSPALVAGTGPCDDVPAGFTLQGTWTNPTNPVGATPWIGGVFATQPAATRAIAQIQFDTAAITYAAYIVERSLDLAADPTMPFTNPIGPSHYQIVFPNVPTSLALCLSATSPGIGYTVVVQGSTPDVAGLATGTGRPGTAQTRSLRAQDCSVACTSIGYVRSDDTAVGAPTNWVGSEFERLCSYTDPVTIGFKCGP
jgi:hypothetical protein